MDSTRFRFFDAFWENQRFWFWLIIVGGVFRIWQVIVLQNPLDALFSDPGRHWDNAKDFLHPGPMGNANAIFYQFWLHLVQFITRSDRTAIALYSAALSLSLPYFWHLFARELLPNRLHLVRVTTVVCWLPSYSFMYMYFMTETLLLPLLGASLWMTWRSVRLNSPLAFFISYLLWLCAVFTRPVVLPGAIICLLWSGSRLQRRLFVLLLCLICTVPALMMSARHSREHFGYSSVLGHDGILNAIYFFSGKKTWTIKFAHGYWYIYESPSFSFNPFAPFFEWRSARDGTIDIFQDRKLEGLDLKEKLYGVVYANYPQLGKLMWENALFFFFGHSWPEAREDRIDGLLSLWERWLWFPVFFASFVGCLREVVRERKLLVFPVLVVLMSLLSFATPVAVMEGRYRKPVALLWLVSIAWIINRRGSQKQLI